MSAELPSWLKEEEVGTPTPTQKAFTGTEEANGT